MKKVKDKRLSFRHPAKKKSVSIRDLYRIIVGRGHVSPAYFLDEMSFLEIADYLDGMEQGIRDEWERARMLMWVTAQVNSTDEIEPSDLMRFPWEQDQEDVDDTYEIEELRKRAANFKK